MWGNMMIDIYALNKIKKITSHAYFNEDKTSKDELHKMLMKIRNLVK